MELLLQQNRDLINSLLHNSENLSHAIDEEVKNRVYPALHIDLRKGIVTDQSLHRAVRDYCRERLSP